MKKIDDIISEVKNIPIETIIGQYINLVPKGRHYMGLCPFHHDKKIGSFIVTPDKNIWECFTDGIGGSAIKFVSLYDNIDYISAAFKIAAQYNIISQEEYHNLSCKKFSKDISDKKIKSFEKAVSFELRKAPEKIIADIYAAMAEVCDLSDKHRRHLIRERGLKASVLKDYFTFPSTKDDIVKKIYLLLAEKCSEKRFSKPLKNLSENEIFAVDAILKEYLEELPYVPGFFLNSKKQIRFASCQGIGFLVRDEKGIPKGIQIRRDNIKDNESRYIWFSSSFALNKKSYEGGASPGTPAGVIYPESISKSRLWITEGRFKAEYIANTGNTAIYLAGVSSWRSIENMLSFMKQYYCKVYLAFDADMMGNQAVHKQLLNLKKMLDLKGFESYVILWSLKDGKGFDDLVLNKGWAFKSYLKCLHFDKFEAVYQACIQQADNDLQETVENAFGL